MAQTTHTPYRSIIWVVRGVGIDYEIQNVLRADATRGGIAHEVIDRRTRFFTPNVNGGAGGGGYNFRRAIGSSTYRIYYKSTFGRN